MPDPIRRRFGYGQLWPLRPAYSQDRAGSYMPDPISRIRFDSVLPQKAWIKLTVQIRPGSDLGGLVRFWPNGSGTEARRCARTIGPGFWQDATVPPATRFPLSDPVAFFHRQPGSYCAKPARIRLIWFSSSFFSSFFLFLALQYGL